MKDHLKSFQSSVTVSDLLTFINKHKWSLVVHMIHVYIVSVPICESQSQQLLSYKSLAVQVCIILQAQQERQHRSSLLDSGRWLKNVSKKLCMTYNLLENIKSTWEISKKGQNLFCVFTVKRPKNTGAMVTGVLTTNVSPMTGGNGQV